MMTEPVYTLAATACMGLTDRSTHPKGSGYSHALVVQVESKGGQRSYIEPGSRIWLLCCQQTGTVDLIGGTEQLREVRLRTGVVPCPLAL